ncbi:MAG: WYL domain-containing protein [Oscillospiraceae bacterium]|nr:WYL domain-containing protein [Oscillospiraceae bacterium]
MPRSSVQKLKLLYIMDYLLQYSDAEHPVTVRQLIAHLAAHDIAAERKSIYDDIEALRTYGLDVEQVADGRFYGYYVASRRFELPELKLLVDSVQSSKFITQRKTNALIRKIETLASSYDAQRLQRQVYVAGRVKTMNESIYYNVDAVHAGISEDKKIRFRYFEYTVAKERRYRRDGAYYIVSPYALTWDDENYYMVAYETETDSIRHYRVDKMTNIATVDEPRDGAAAYRSLDMAMYSRKVFGMFSGTEQRVKLRFTNHLVGAVLDRLGQDVSIIPDGDDHFTVSADVVVSPQFFAWLCGFGADAQLLAPASAAEQMKAYIEEIAALYR